MKEHAHFPASHCGLGIAGTTVRLWFCICLNFIYATRWSLAQSFFPDFKFTWDLLEHKNDVLLIKRAPLYKPFQQRHQTLARKRGETHHTNFLRPTKKFFNDQRSPGFNTLVRAPPPAFHSRSIFQTPNINTNTQDAATSPSTPHNTHPRRRSPHDPLPTPYPHRKSVRTLFPPRLPRIPSTPCLTLPHIPHHPTLDSPIPHFRDLTHALGIYLLSLITS